MKVRHKDKKLEQLEADPNSNAEGAYSTTVIRGFRKAMHYIRHATDERDIRNFKSLHYHKLQKPRAHQHAVDVSDQFRLILEWEGTGADRTIVVVEIEDYH
jgi:proteic killer suppression protein